MTEEKREFEILYKDEHFIAINKPAGFMVHRSSLDPYTTDLVIQHLRNQIQQRVYPIHRLDRKTSGVLLLALSKEALSKTNELFRTQQVKKEYLSIVRGHTDSQFDIDYSLKNSKDIWQEAWTTGYTISTSECPWQTSKFKTSRYSLIKLVPHTGRTHQLRKHMAHIFHPIIGDRPHGCNKQNKYFKDQHQMMNMLLHAHQLTIEHPYTRKSLQIKASLPIHFLEMMQLLQLSL